MLCFAFNHFDFLSGLSYFVCMIERREKKKMPKKHYFTIISCCVRLVSLNDSYVPVLVPLPVVDHVPLDIWGCKRWRRRLTSYVPLPCGRPIIHDLKHSSIDCHMQSGLYRCLWGDEHAAHCRMAREIIMTIYCPGCCSRCCLYEQERQPCFLRLVTYCSAVKHKLLIYLSALFTLSPQLVCCCFLS